MKIKIKNLSLQTIIGVEDHERTRPRTVIVNVEMEADCTAAAATDDIEQAVDYAAITDQVTSVVSESRFMLLESLAARILDTVMSDSRIRRATVEVDKPGALEGAESVSVVAMSEEIE